MNSQLRIRPIIVSALPLAVDLILYAGDDFTLTLTVTNPDGSDLDLEDAVARSQIRAGPDTPEIAGEFVVTIVGNLVVLHLPAAVSTGIPERAVWDCELEHDDTRLTLAGGSVRMRPQVTR